MAKISARQLFFFLACVAPVGKIILMPSALVQAANNDLLFPAAANFLLQAGVIFLVMLLSRSNQTFYQLLANTFGKIAAKIISVALTLFLLYCALLPILEQKLFVQSIFYDTLPSLIAFAPFFIFSAYLCAKQLSSLGRIWDIIAPISIVGFFGIIVLAVGNADFGALMPVGAGGGKGFLRGTAYTMLWFYDSLLVLMLMGRFEYKKGMAWKAAVFYLVGAAAVLFFLAVFYGIFSDIAIRQIFAFAKISRYFSAITVLGRIDYIFIYALGLVMAFYCAMPMQAAAECLSDAFGGGTLRSALYSVGINAVMLTITIALDYSFGSVRDTVGYRLFWLFPAVCVGLPMLALCLRRKKYEQIR